MDAIHFTIPSYPHRRRFSDPYIDFELEEEKLACIASLTPDSLSAFDLLTLFNGWLPAGSFEEMAPYILPTLKLIRDLPEDPQDQLGFQLLENLIIWCHKEQTALMSKENSKLLQGIQKAMMALFHYWSGQTATGVAPNGPRLLHETMLRTLLTQGDKLATYGRSHRVPLPWLRSTHFLPLLMELDSIPHAAWLLRHYDDDIIFGRRKYSVPAGLIRRALDIVEDWLLSGKASETDIALWAPTATYHRLRLNL